MTCRLEYDVRVQRSLPAPVAAFAVLALCLVASVPGASAQTHGAPASVTSQGFGGHAFNGTAPSVTSLGAHGSTPNSHQIFPGSRPGSVTRADGHVHHPHHDGYGYGAGYWVGVPYAVDLASPPDKNEDQNEDNAQEPEDDEAGYQGGPTIFDRRGLGASSYVPPVTDMPRPHETSQYADPADDTPQAQTVLVFKNRQQLEVSNYAIQGGTLFDLTPGHSRRIALADLDLAATQLQNENRGVVFALPVAPAN
jgi:hypothetical protein